MQSNNKRENRKLAHRTELSMALGCTVCMDQELCGGLRTEEGIYDCTSFCRCSEAQKRRCPFVCPNKPSEYVRRMREVGGFDLGTIGTVPPVSEHDLPAVVPWIDGHGCLTGPLPILAAAIPLRKLFRGRTGRAVDQSREALTSRFALQRDAALLVTGVSFEQPIEDYWSAARNCGFLDELAVFKPELVTTPNFSLFSDTPRDDNMYNMKRIAICWHELAERGIPTALHVNARTDRDWQRWGEFLAAHPEIRSIAFEFSTGAAPLNRARWYVRRLVALGSRFGGRLRLVLRGGRIFVGELRAHFSGLTIIATDPLMRARKRRRLAASGNRLRWHRVPYHRGEKLDSLFLENLAEYTHLLQ